MNGYQTIAPRGGRPFSIGIAPRPQGGGAVFNPENLGTVLFWGTPESRDGSNWINAGSVASILNASGNVIADVQDGFEGFTFADGRSGNGGYFSGTLSQALASGRFHMFLVAKPWMTDATDQSFFTYGSGISGDNLVYALSQGGAYKVNLPPGGNQFQGNSGSMSTDATLRLLEFSWDSVGDVQFFEDGVEWLDGVSPPGNHLGSAAGTDFSMGTDISFETKLFGSGWFCPEFILYKGECSDPVSVRSHLISKYGLA